jgi:hypothetical protein
MKKYDVIIVGAGLAGLYAAYKIRKMFGQGKSVLVLEKADRKGLGGRAGQSQFYGSTVVTGAGVGRKKKDHFLMQLLKDLGVKTTEFESQPHFAPTIRPPCDVRKLFLFLKAEYNKYPNRPHKTFKQFAAPLLGQTLYTHFLICSGYTDYENEDAYDVFYTYGFDDNFTKWTAVGIPWRNVVDLLCTSIGDESIKTSAEVQQVRQLGPREWTVAVKNGPTYMCKKVIIATTIDAIRKLVPTSPSIYRGIEGQPFLRIYAKFNKESAVIMATVAPAATMVPSSLHRVIPMNKGNGLYMIAYTDNQGAVYLKNRGANNAANRAFFCRLLEHCFGLQSNTLSITALKGFYWPIGTHFYTPLSNHIRNRTAFIHAAQRPFPHMRVVGEAVSSNQGWVEGALESVEKVIVKNWVE